MASLWKFPVIYLCENNGYAISTSVARSHGQPSIAARGQAYGMPSVMVDGQDVRAVHEATQSAVARARGGGGPTLIEAKTYRFDEHQVGLIVPGAPYRTAEEIAGYTGGRDPITLYKAVLLTEGIAEAELKSIEDDVAVRVAEAIQFAEESPLPDPASLYDYLHA
jgi:pyruvate dehydrogenase E1 component alpha subunit